MTAPFDYTKQTRALDQGLRDAAGNARTDNSAADAEWASYDRTHKMLLDELFNILQPPTEIAPPDPNDPTKPAASLVPVAPGSTQQKPTREQLDQAHWWNIQNPEQLDAAELQHQIEQRRAGVPRAQQTSLRSALFAGAAADAQAISTLTSDVSNVFGNVADAVSHVPYVGPTLAKMLNTNSSNLWLQHISSKANEAVEAARAAQPQDQTAIQFLTGAGKMAGHVLPAMAAWEGLGAIAGISRLSWLAQSGTPLIRLAAKGALTSALIEDPDAPTGEKVMNIGLGAVMGGASMWGAAGAAVAGGGLGAGVGVSIGDIPEARARHAIEGGVAGATLGLLAPMLAKAFTKVKASFPDGTGPVSSDGWEPVNPDEFDPNAEWNALRRVGPGPTRTPSGSTQADTVDADWHFIDENTPQTSGNPVPQRFFPGGQSGPPAQNAEQLATLLHSEPPRQLGAGGSPEPVQSEQGTQLGAPRVAGYLETPGDRPAEVDALINAQHFRQILMDAPDLDAPHPYDPSKTLRETYEGKLAESLRLADAGRYVDRQLNAKINSGLASVSNGPAHLVGSKVADNLGRPLRVYHGTGVDFEEFDPTKLDSEAMYGPGIYHTENPEIASGYAGELAGSTSLDLLPNGTIDYSRVPNIRPAYLDIKNPFNIDHEYSIDEVNQLASRLNETTPGYKWSAVADEVARESNGQIEGKTLYNLLADAEVSNSQQGPTATIFSRFPRESDPFLQEHTIAGKAGLNTALQNAGFDGITHIGGANTGNPPHRVWIAFDPMQVHPAYAPRPLATQDAVAAAEAITKQATIMESQTLPQAIAKVEITDADVVSASKAANPGGLSIVRGVGKPMDVMMQHPGIQFIERDGKLDALVGNFTPEQVKDYQRFGTYEDNLVVTASGVEGTVIGVSGKGIVTIKRTGGGPPMRVRHENVLPTRFSTPVYEGKDLWPSFKADLFRYVNEEAQKASMASAEDLTDPRITSLMQTHLEDYLSRRGINDQGTRHAIDVAINNSYVEEMSELDPEAKELRDRADDTATIEANTREIGDDPIPASLEDKAETRGFLWLSQPGADGGTLRDLINPEGAFETVMQTDEAAEEFLQNIDRTLPDQTPVSDVPFELFGSAVPTGRADFTVSEADELVHMADAIKLGDEDLDELETEQLKATLARATQASNPPGGGVPVPPPQAPAGFPPAGSGGGGQQPPINPPRVAGGQPPQPPQPPTAGSQFGNYQSNFKSKYTAMARKWAGNSLRYTRYFMQSLEADFQRRGISLAKPWRDLTSLETATTKAHNEAFDWHNESGSIFRKFKPTLLRSGFVARTMEIANAAQRAARWQGLSQKGYSANEIQRMMGAEAELTNFLDKLLTFNRPYRASLQPTRELFRYIGTVRQRQAQGITGSALYDGSGILSPELAFFAKHAEAHDMQFQTTNVSQLTNHLVHSLMWAKYQEAPYRQLITNWSDQRIPENIRNTLIGAADAVKYGNKPEVTIAVKAIRGAVEGILGVPITNKEAARIAGLPLAWQYISLLAGKTAIFFRDATQPLLALTKVHSRFMADSYNNLLGYWRKGVGHAQLLADYQLALKHGWVTRGAPAMEGATSFGEAQPGDDPELFGLTPQELASRERVAQAADILLPQWMRRLAANVNTLKPYGKLQELNQFLVGNAAFKQAKVGLAEYRQLEMRAALSGNPSLAMSYDQFAANSFFSSFGTAIKTHLQDLVLAGNDEEAAATFAREVVKWSQDVYTTREKPKFMRTGIGKWGSTFVNTSGQFAEAAVNALANGSAYHRARAVMVIAGFGYTMHKLGDMLGMKRLSSFGWQTMLQYAGSPMLELAMQAAEAYGGAMAQADDRSPNPVQRAAIENLPGMAEVGLNFFPATGYLRSADAISAAAQGTTPVRDITRFVVTGDRGSGINYLLDSRARAAEFQQRYDPRTSTLAPRPVGSLSPNGGTMQPPTPTQPAVPPSKHPGSGGQQ